jgi:hypothetical protein
MPPVGAHVMMTDLFILILLFLGLQLHLLDLCASSASQHPKLSNPYINRQVIGGVPINII